MTVTSSCSRTVEVDLELCIVSLVGDVAEGVLGDGVNSDDPCLVATSPVVVDEIFALTSYSEEDALGFGVSSPSVGLDVDPKDSVSDVIGVTTELAAVVFSGPSEVDWSGLCVAPIVSISDEVVLRTDVLCILESSGGGPVDRVVSNISVVVSEGRCVVSVSMDALTDSGEVTVLCLSAFDGVDSVSRSVDAVTLGSAGPLLEPDVDSFSFDPSV
ncbi:unnamed protein product [Cylicostephanus goldi]|uniref:Uncharacterized protein n=1 Tax=Cylicostephanus goldi TaxID=71465 RepID=A0A3P6PKL0_CYLGO|nr:unnamed protein product [Cylicostephanus goldi]